MRTSGAAAILGCTLALLITAACTPTSDTTTSPVVVVDDVNINVTPDAVIDIEFVNARDAALASTSAQYGEEAPRETLAWITADVTPEGQGSLVIQYSAEDWTITVACMMLFPDGCTYHTLVINDAAGFRWEGEVNAAGQVTIKPPRVPVTASERVLAARDAALAYLVERHGDEAPEPGLTWRDEYITPEGWIGSADFRFTAGEWVISLSYAILPPERTVYRGTVASEVTGFEWEGEVDAAGSIRESSHIPQGDDLSDVAQVRSGPAAQSLSHPTGGLS